MLILILYKRWLQKYLWKHNKFLKRRCPKSVFLIQKIFSRKVYRENTIQSICQHCLTNTFFSSPTYYFTIFPPSSAETNLLCFKRTFLFLACPSISLTLSFFSLMVIFSISVCFFRSLADFSLFHCFSLFVGSWTLRLFPTFSSLFLSRFLIQPQHSVRPPLNRQLLHSLLVAKCWLCPLDKTIHTNQHCFWWEALRDNGRKRKRLQDKHSDGEIKKR